MRRRGDCTPNESPSRRRKFRLRATFFAFHVIRPPQESGSDLPRGGNKKVARAHARVSGPRGTATTTWVDPFCRSTSAVCSESGPKCDAAAYSAARAALFVSKNHRQRIIAMNNRARARASTCASAFFFFNLLGGGDLYSPKCTAH